MLKKSFKQFLELLYKKESSAMNLPQFLIESINGQLINFNAKLGQQNPPLKVAGLSW